MRRAQEAGLVRSDFAPLLQLSAPIQMCQTYLAYLPLYQVLILGEDLASPVARAREHIVALVVAGIMADRPETVP